MNQTSVPSLVVPVFPPAGFANSAPTDAAAVPRRMTSFIALTMSHDSSGDMTGTRVTSGSHSTSPFALSTRVIAWGMARDPSVANVEYAATISIGYTSAAPMKIDG